MRDRLKENPNYIQENLNDIACSVQKTVVETLLYKFEKALKDTGISTMALAGGVSANSLLREKFFALGQKYNCKVFIPKFSYTTDNAAMVGSCGMFKFLRKDFADMSLTAYAR